MKKNTIKINDMGGTGTKVKVKYDNDIVKITSYNHHFKHILEIPTGIFAEIAATVIHDYTHGRLDDE
jgi:hypothetical protein